MYSIWSKIKHYVSPTKVFALAGLATLVALSFTHPLGAQSVTQGYSSDVVLQRGMIVVVREDDQTKIEPAKPDTMERIHGIVVNPNDAPFTVSNEEQKNFVATVGRYDVLVSNQNGDVLAGDYLTISSIEGIAMKADRNQRVIVGRALTEFKPGSGTTISTAQLTDSDGQNQAVDIGRVEIDIGVSRNPLLRPEQANVPEFLRRASEGIAQKSVSAVRVYMGLVILAISSTIAGSMLFSGIRSAVISIGRNPLSKKSIVRGLLQVVLTSLIVFITGLFGVYLLIRL